jgi:hypothetical protein
MPLLVECPHCKGTGIVAFRKDNATTVPIKIEDLDELIDKKHFPSEAPTLPDADWLQKRLRRIRMQNRAIFMMVAVAFVLVWMYLVLRGP